MTRKMLASLRERFDTGRGPITMSELDMLITYAEESMRWRSKAEEAIEELKRIT